MKYKIEEEKNEEKVQKNDLKVGIGKMNEWFV